MAVRPVVLYELNEVPWRVIDLYVERRPHSTLARTIGAAASVTTVVHDPAPLQPWRTWPTLHTSTPTAVHGSWDLGQDPATFSAVPLWDAAADAGRSVGLFGPLQSWPPRRFPGGFHVPDTFAADASTDPPALGAFQRFNLAMTERNAFGAVDPLDARALAAAAVDIARLGLTTRSAVRLVAHVVRERYDPRWKGARAVMQAVLGFDLFRALWRDHRPDLGVFFTNHVAGVMHRWWGDAVPGYTDANDYTGDDVAARFLVEAMDVFDRHLDVLRRGLAQMPGSVLVVASSMGQGPVPYRHIDRTYVVDDLHRLSAALGLGGEPGLAMYPRSALTLPSDDGAERAATALASVATSDAPVFHDIRAVGRSVTFEIDYRYDADVLATDVRWRGAGGEARTGSIGDLGIVTRARPGGGNTAYHVPEGILLAWGDGIAADASRVEVDVLDVAPSVLALLDVPVPDAMRGCPSLFGVSAPTTR